MNTRKINIAGVGLYLILTATLLILASGCTKSSINGDLDGQWQVLEVTKGDVSVKFPEGEIYYYNFYLHTFQLTYTGNRSTRMTGNMVYDKEAATLGLELGFVKEGRVDKTLIDRLVYWGFPVSGEAVMKIRELTGSRLVMEHGDVTVVCRKF